MAHARLPAELRPVAGVRAGVVGHDERLRVRGRRRRAEREDEQQEGRQRARGAAHGSCIGTPAAEHDLGGQDVSQSCHKVGVMR